MQTPDSLKRSLFESLCHMGDTHRQLGQADKAVESYQQALGIARQFGDRDAEGLLLRNLGMASQKLDPGRAVEFYELALRILGDIGDTAGEFDILTQLARLAADQGDPGRSIAYGERALNLARMLGDSVREYEIRSQLSSRYLEADNIGAGIEQYEQVLVLAHNLNDPAGRADVLERLAALYAEHGELQRAIDLYRDAAEQAHGSGIEEARLLALLGAALAADGQHEHALDVYQRAVAILDQHNNLIQKSAVLAALGVSTLALGQWNLIRSIYKQIQTPGKGTQESLWLGGVEMLNSRLALLGEVLTHLRQADLTRPLNHAFAEAHYYDNIAALCTQHRQLYAATKAYERGIELAQQAGDQRSEGIRRVEMALVYSVLGAATIAHELAQQAQETFHRLGNAADIAWCENRISALVTD